MTVVSPPTTPVTIVLTRLHGPMQRLASWVAHTRPPLSAMTSPPKSVLAWIQRPEFWSAASVPIAHA